MENSIKILVASTQYTGYGGAATVAYALIKYLRSLEYKCSGLFFNKSKCVNYDPNSLGNIYLLTYSYTSHQKYVKNITEPTFDENAKNKIVNDICINLDSSPNVILCIGSHSSTFCRELFPESKIVMITSGIVYYRHNVKISSVRNLLELLSGPTAHFYKKASYAKQEIDDMRSSDLIVPNSDLMLDVYRSIYPEYSEKIYTGYFDTSKIVETLDDVKFDCSIKKDIDIIIISSRLDRYEKNILFLLPILEKYSEYSKCFIGENKKHFEHLPNSIFTDLIPHGFVYNYLSRAKLLIVPSLYESSNNAIREALQCKCLILTSNNVGFYSLYPKFSICESYDLSEWESKMIFLLENYDSLIVDYKIDFNGSCTIKDICDVVFIKSDMDINKFEYDFI